MDNIDNNCQESLQPQRISKEERGYQSVLDIIWRFQVGDATNIALTGPYGSGKSTILKTLKHDFPQYQYLNISLATLEPADDKKEEDSDISKENLDRLIEYSILQQIIYREKQEVLPNSRFKRIFHLPDVRIRKITISIILAILAGIVLFEPPYFKVEWIYNLLCHNWLNIIGDGLSVLYLIWFSYKVFERLVPIISNSRLNKVNLKDGEIEIVENTSIFNKHLDEILYFFEQTEYDVVILEDLDRFNNIDIFLKLRELNLLLNESKVVGRKIYFIYAVRDDMFKDTERVKCFDYITTVIPVINRSNAKNQLKSELKKRGVTEINDKHLANLGFFLYDMRLLKNIANEYVQYRGKLEKGISCEKLLAMIIYKNYFPKDFADLHNCKGIVYQLINLKEIFISNKIILLENEIKNKQEQALKYRNEKHLKESELRRLYVDAYRDRLGNRVQQLKAGKNFHDLKQIADSEDLFNQLVSSSSVTYTYIAGNDTYYSGRTQQASANIPFSEIERDVDPNDSFNERLETLRTGFVELENSCVTDIKKEDIRVQPLSQLLKELDYPSIPQYKDLEVPKLVEYLVVNGYIDENYYDYISYFYDNFIDAHDWDFILNVKMGRTLPYDYRVNDIVACLSEIPNAIYRKPSILNITIVDYLSSRQKDRLNAAKMSVILRTVVDNTKFDFLTDYFEKGNNQDTFFHLLFAQHKNLWGAFEKFDQANNTLKLIWYKYAEKDFSCTDSREWISQHYNFITEHLFDIETEQWCLLIKTHQYNFNNLNNYSGDLLKVIAERDGYELSRHNITVLVSNILDSNYDSISYRLILETQHEQLIQRINDNLEICLASVFTKPESCNENEESIIIILESTAVSENARLDYLIKQKTVIGFDNINSSEAKRLALKSNVIEAVWENIIYYMNEVGGHKADSELLHFIEQHDNNLSNLAIPIESEENERMLIEQLIGTNQLSLESYTKLLKVFDKWYFDDGIPDIEERRIRLLIEKKMIRFSEANTEDLMQKYSAKTVVAYFINNKKEFFNHSGSIEYTSPIAIELMASKLSARDKASLLAFFEKKVLTKDLANQVIALLAQQDINLDIDFLLETMRLSSIVKEKILVFCDILSKYKLEEKDITSFLLTLPNPYCIIGDKGKKPEIPNSEQNRILIERLKEKDYISSFSYTKNGMRVNTKLK